MATPRRFSAPTSDNRGARVAQIGEPDFQDETIDINAMIQNAQHAVSNDEINGVEPHLQAPQGQAAETPAPAPEPAPEPTPAEPTPATPPPVEVDPIVDRFRKMTPEQQAEAYVNLERLRGKQGEELGLLRKMAEKIVTGEYVSQAPVTQPPQPAKPAPVDLKSREELVTRLLTEPDVVVSEIINQTIQTQKNLGKQEQIDAKLQEVKQRYESDRGFAQYLDSVPGWIKDAANTPEAIDHIVQQYTPATQPTRPSAPAQLGTSAAPSAAARPQTTGKIWTHAELADMMHRRPQEYAARQVEIWKAFDEGRVR